MVGLLFCFAIITIKAVRMFTAFIKRKCLKSLLFLLGYAVAQAKTR